MQNPLYEGFAILCVFFTVFWKKFKTKVGCLNFILVNR
jgi:hypothetical protein